MIFCKRIVRKSQEKNALEPSLHELGLGDLILDKTAIKTTESPCECLETIEVGAKALSRRDVTILKSEKIFEYILQNLKKETSPIALELYQSIKKRILVQFVTLNLE